MRGILQVLGLPECRIAMVSSMIKYGIVIYWSNEDEAFVAEVPELPGCAAHGATHSAALSNALDAIGLWMDTAKEFGIRFPRNEKSQRSSGWRNCVSELRSEASRPTVGSSLTVKRLLLTFADAAPSGSAAGPSRSITPNRYTSDTSVRSCILSRFVLRAAARL